jgi:hypothetical protein
MNDEVERAAREAGEPDSTREAIAGLLRVAGSAWWHTAEWGLRGYAEAGRRMAERVVGESATQAASDVAHDLGRAVGALVRESGIDERVRDAAASSDTVQSATDIVQTVAQAVPSLRDGRGSREPTLQELGEDLLRRSRDVWNEEQGHPAYERILSELAPDEARILRLLYKDGPQPSVDVRTGGPVGLLSSRLIAPGLNMIGPRAGLRSVDQVPAYLNNLYRLGLVWFSRELVRDHLEYQVVEAQPEVLEAMHSTRFPRIVRRSIHLTPFGADFCRVALAVEAKPETLPAHASPEGDDAPHLATLVVPADAEAEKEED